MRFRKLLLSFLLTPTVGLGLAALLVAGAASAASISYYVDQTNIDGYLDDGTNYLQVTIEDVGTDIRITVDILPALANLAVGASNFGIQAFAFNSANPLSATDITGLPTLWVTDLSRNGSGFGLFDVQVSDTGQARQNPTLTFDIVYDGDSIFDYALPSDGNAGEGNAYFSAHVADFNDQDLGTGIVTSGWFGGVPEPSTALLLLGGLAGLAAWEQRRLH